MKTNPADKTLTLKQKELKRFEKKFGKARWNSPLLRISVDSRVISDVISGWTGIPTGRMLVNEIDTVLRMDRLLGERIIGQDHALNAIAQMVRTAHAGIEDPSKPTAVLPFRRSKCVSARLKQRACPVGAYLWRRRKTS